MTKEEFAVLNVDKDAEILEFAPAHAPMYAKRDGWKVKIVDYMDRDGLVNRVNNDSRVHVSSEMIEDVDYVCCRDYSKHINRTFDVIASSHFIEHTIDIIGHFNDCSKMIKDDGIIKLIIPDKRYIFDCFRETVSTRSAIDAHTFLQSNHSLGTILESRVRACFYKGETYIPNSIWRNIDELEWNWNEVEDFENHLSCIKENYSFDNYQDTHSWVMTPCSFELMVYELNVLGYIDLFVDKIITDSQCSQFYVELKKGKVGFNEQKEKELLLNYKLEKEEEKDRTENDDLFYNMIKQSNGSVYIYGAGDNAKIALEYAKKKGVRVVGYVVSNGHKDKETIYNLPIKEISEIEPYRNEFIVIGTTKYREEVEKILQQKNFVYSVF